MSTLSGAVQIVSIRLERSSSESALGRKLAAARGILASVGVPRLFLILISTYTSFFGDNPERVRN
jgi:hypothetical protein